MSSPYQGALTCISCQIVFETGETHRVHYKTDWHRYNLKRKIINLPPVDQPTFESRILKQQAQQDEENSKGSIYCTICKKSYSSQKSFDSHTSSKQHKSLANNIQCLQNNNFGVPAAKKLMKPIINKPDENMDDDDGYEDVEDDEDEEWNGVVSENNPIVNNICLFCPRSSENLFENIKHMSIDHSFFLPDIEYLVDIKGLLVYLGEKICQGFMCLWCNDSGKNFQSMGSAQAHMIDKGFFSIVYSLT